MIITLINEFDGLTKQTEEDPSKNPKVLSSDTQYELITRNLSSSLKAITSLSYLTDLLATKTTKDSQTRSSSQQHKAYLKQGLLQLQNQVLGELAKLEED